MKFKISCLLTLQILHNKFGPVILEKMLTHDGQRTSHSNMSSVWLRWLKKVEKKDKAIRNDFHISGDNFVLHPWCRNRGKNRIIQALKIGVETFVSSSPPPPSFFDLLLSLMSLCIHDLFSSPSSFSLTIFNERQLFLCYENLFLN